MSVQESESPFISAVQHTGNETPNKQTMPTTVVPYNCKD